MEKIEIVENLEMSDQMKSKQFKSEETEKIETKTELEKNEKEESNDVGTKSWKDKIPKWLSPFIGLLISCIAAVFYGFSYVVVKWLENVDSFTISVFRFIFILVLTLPAVIYARFRHQTSCLPEGLRLALIGRSIFGSTNHVFHFYALKHLPLADTNLIAATSPIFTVIFARIFLKEKMYKLDLLNIVLVFGGIIMVVKPPFLFGENDAYQKDSQYVLAVILLLVGALFQANVYVLLRFLKDVPLSTVLFTFGWVGTIVAGISSISFGCHCLPEGISNWMWMLLIGLLSYFGQIGLTVSAKFESATKVSLYRKSFDIIFAILFQITIFHEIPDALKICGAVLITGAVLSSGIKKLFDLNCKRK